jgi:hypothetical protein
MSVLTVCRGVYSAQLWSVMGFVFLCFARDCNFYSKAEEVLMLIVLSDLWDVKIWYV